ncbi:MAG: methyltransferase domain-containing protein [Bacillota bacterium]|nr:methyltransferase domain-containing protein [Bacillota bacterium]
MRTYFNFADYYDELMQNAEYNKRCEYIAAILKNVDHDFGLTLDLACGSGSLTVELAKKGIDIYGIDASPEMLSKAQQKAAEDEMQILFLCQKMQNIDLYGTIDTCICTLDSINHLTKQADVQETFKRVSLFMNPGGYFLFDVNSEYKHRNILCNNNFILETDNVFCVWQNELLKDGRTVSIQLDFFEKIKDIYKRTSENFCETAYSDGEIKEMLKNAGLDFVDCFEDMTFNPPNAESQKIFYIAKKP